MLVVCACECPHVVSHSGFLQTCTQAKAKGDQDAALFPLCPGHVLMHGAFGRTNGQRHFTLGVRPAQQQDDDACDVGVLGSQTWLQATLQWVVGVIGTCIMYHLGLA